MYMYIYNDALNAQSVLSPRPICFLKKKEEIYNIYIDIYIREQDATLFDITR